MPPDRPQPGALLCPRCGYPLESTPDVDACPECGAPAEMADPAYRIGSAWQRRPSFGSWVLTGLSLVRWRQTFDLISVGRHDADWLLRLNLVLASVLLAAAFAEDRIDKVFLHSRGSAAGLMGALLVLTPAWYVVLRGLTAIERAGLQFFGNRRGGRVTPGIARVVTAHASYGWIVAGVLAVIGAFVGHAVLRTWYNQAGAGWMLTALPSHVVFGLVGFFAGLLVFETLSYIGLMRCRFANPPLASNEVSLETSRSETSPNDRPPTAEPTL